MDTRNGDLYPNREAARAAGVPARHLVEVTGPRTAIAELSAAARARNAKRERNRRRMASESRRRNRTP